MRRIARGKASQALRPMGIRPWPRCSLAFHANTWTQLLVSGHSFRCIRFAIVAHSRLSLGVGEIGLDARVLPRRYSRLPRGLRAPSLAVSVGHTNTTCSCMRARAGSRASHNLRGVSLRDSLDELLAAAPVRGTYRTCEALRFEKVEVPSTGAVCFLWHGTHACEHVRSMRAAAFGTGGSKEVVVRTGPGCSC